MAPLAISLTDCFRLENRNSNSNSSSKNTNNNTLVMTPVTGTALHSLRHPLQKMRKAANTEIILILKNKKSPTKN